jgi:hypothetical protein
MPIIQATKETYVEGSWSAAGLHKKLRDPNQKNLKKKGKKVDAYRRDNKTWEKPQFTTISSHGNDSNPMRKAIIPLKKLTTL